LNTVLLAGLTLALLLAVVALVREVRLRRAVQTLLRRLLSRWRAYVEEDTDVRHGNRDDRRRDRLR
jgi:hypothetical protein